MYIYIYIYKYIYISVSDIPSGIVVKLTGALLAHRLYRLYSYCEDVNNLLTSLNRCREGKSKKKNFAKNFTELWYNCGTTPYFLLVSFVLYRITSNIFT